MANDLFNAYGKLDFATSFSPLTAFPLDARSMFASFEEARAAAMAAVPVGSSDGVYYFGQTLTVLDATGVATSYLIEPVDAADPAKHGQLKEVGSTTLGDNKTIVLTDGNTLSLREFGTHYHKWHAADNVIDGEWTYPGNMPSTSTEAFAKAGDVWYKYVVETGWVEADAEPITDGYHEKVEGFMAGLVPQTVADPEGNGYVIEWYEQSNETAAGLNNNLSAIQQSVNANTDAIALLNSTAETEGSVDYKIAQVLNAYLTGDGVSDKIDTLKDLVAWAEAHETDVANYGTDIEANKQAIADLQALIGTELPAGVNAANVIEYIQQVDEAVKLAVTAVTKGDVNGHISVTVNGATQDVSVYELPVATTTTVGGVMADGVTVNIDSNGMLSVVMTADSAIMQQVNTSINNAKNEAIETAAMSAAELYVPKNNMATSDSVAEDPASASTEKAASEELVVSAMSWVEGM